MLCSSDLTATRLWSEAGLKQVVRSASRPRSEADKQEAVE